MSAAPATQHATKLRIGEILLELGFVSEKQLAKAVEEQSASGKPLGQILVEHGAITRLELASALAEQWSAHSPISPISAPPSEARPAQAPPQPHDEDRYAARLQAAIADLAHRDHAPPADQTDDPRVTDLAERLEATVARAQRLEATVATLAESVDGVTGGIEEAFSVLQSGMSGMAVDLARVETTLADIAERPVVQPGLDDRLAAIEAALDEQSRTAAAAVALEDLAARLATLEGAPPGVTPEALADALAGVRDELQPPPTAADPRIDQLVDALTELRDETERIRRLSHDGAGLGERLSAVEGALEHDRSRAESLARADAVEELAATVDALRLEIAQQLEHERTELAARVGGLETRMEAIEGLDSLRDDLEAMKTALAGLEGRAPAASPDDVSTAVDGLRAEMTSLEPRFDAIAERLADAERRHADDVVTLRHEVEALRAAPTADAEQTRALAELTERLDRQAAATDAAVAEIQARLVVAPVPLSADDLAREIDAVRSDLAAPVSRLDELVVEAAALRKLFDEELAPLRGALVADISALRHEIEAIRAAPTADPDETRALAELIERLDRQAAAAESTLADVVARVDVMSDSPLTHEALEHALAEIRHELRGQDDPRVDALALQLSELRESMPQGAEDDRPSVHELASQLERYRTEAAAQIDAVRALTEEVAPVTSEVLARAIDDVRGKLAAAQADLDPRIADLAAEVVSLRSRLPEATAAAASDPPSAFDVASLHERLDALEARTGTTAGTGLEAHVEEMVSLVSARVLAEGVSAQEAVVSPAGVSGIPASEGIEGDIERTRMAIERLSAHLGEHDRAIRELMKAQGGGRGTRGGGDADAGARIESAAGRAEAAADLRSVMRRIEGMEEDAREDREKLLKRLERLATSIDWRLQRLESAE